MEEFFGVILIDASEIMLRVYGIENDAWQLLHAINLNVSIKKSPNTLTSSAVVETITEFFSLPYTQNVVEWKIGTVRLPKMMVDELAVATGLALEYLDPLRKKELLCKGMFMELW